MDRDFDFVYFVRDVHMIVLDAITWKPMIFKADVRWNSLGS